MESDEPSTGSRRGWRQRLGLKPATADDSGTWVAVASGQVDDAETGFSEQATRVADALKAAGIEVRLHPYVVPDQRGTGVGLIGAALLVSSPGVTERIRVAVQVHPREVDRVAGIAGHIQHERLQWHSASDDEPISDDELTRLSLGACADLKQETGADS
jgi:hypothetical protein